LRDIRNFEKFLQDSASVAIQHLSINTTDSEFSPVYYNDGIVFSSSRHEGPFTKKSHWDSSPFLNLYYARKDPRQGFADVILFEEDLSTKHHDGPAAFYDDDKKMIINRNQRIKVEGRRKVFEWRPGLYDAVLDGKKSWQVSALPFNNPQYSYMHPWISNNGRIMYFASDMPGGYGGTDIYRVERLNGAWRLPVNLGPSINTSNDEAFPFFVDSTLYFSSNGHGGLGGLDLFKSVLSDDEYSAPVNLGYPLNSTADDFSLITDQAQRTGYYASSRYGNDDLFSFRKLATNQVLALGLVTNSSGDAVDGYKAIVANKKTNSNIPVHVEKGVMNFLGDRGETYTISVEHDKYQNASEELAIPAEGPDTEKFSIVLKNKSEDQNPKLLVVDTDKGTSKMYLKTGDNLNEITEKDSLLYLETPEGNEYLVKGNLSDARTDPSEVLKELGLQKSDRTNLRNIYFDFDMADLDESDKVYLNQVKYILAHDRSLSLVVAGHADDRGDDEYNIKLSRRRVQAVSKYLASQGIDKNRIIAKAFGESLPVVPCFNADCSEEDHQKNRRAEFVLRHNFAGPPTSLLSTPESKGESNNRR
jgi:outer membrane protein OmpA-like peptidoglycan-associated protein